MASPAEAMTEEQRRQLLRWRLVLGKGAEGCHCGARGGPECTCAGPAMGLVWRGALNGRVLGSLDPGRALGRVSTPPGGMVRPGGMARPGGVPRRYGVSPGAWRGVRGVV